MRSDLNVSKAFALQRLNLKVHMYGTHVNNVKELRNKKFYPRWKNLNNSDDIILSDTYKLNYKADQKDISLLFKKINHLFLF